MRVALTLALTASTAFAGSTKEKVVAPLPKGGPFAEVMLSSTRYSNIALLGPIGGPTKGYSVKLTLWPQGPVFTIAMRDGKDELDADPTFIALAKKNLRVSPSPSGDAVVWTIDGKTWRVLYLAPKPFACAHVTVNPASPLPLRDVAKQILTGSGVHDARSALDFNGRLQDDVHREELAGALSFALNDATSGEFLLTFFSSIDQEQFEHLNVDLEAGAGARLAPLFAKKVELKDKLQWLSTHSDFWEAMNGRPVASEAEFTHPTRPPCKPAPIPPGAPGAVTTIADALSRASFPPKIDDATCSAWKTYSAWIEANVSELQKLPAGTSPDAGQPKFMFRSNCGSQVMAMVVSGFPGQRSLRFEGGDAQKVYERDVVRCGHVDQPDPKCEAAVLAKQRAAWAVNAEAARREACWPHEEKLAALRSCIESFSAQPEDGMTISSRAQAWQVFQIFVKEGEAVACRPTVPEFQKPLPFEDGY
ncbi:MAG: hypothetical protein QM817_25325 [Archangium sp.]